MQLVSDTSFAVGWMPTVVQPPQPSLLVVVKATYDLVAKGECTFAPEPNLPTGDLYFDDEVEGSLLYASDFSPFKPVGECWVVGHAHASGGQAKSRVVCRLKVGAVDKTVQVTGDRYFTDSLGGITPAVPFVRMPLVWERSFGHPSQSDNPVGRGLAEDKRGISLPNLEDPRRAMNVLDDRPAPHGFAPIAGTWAARRRYVGTYDAAWQRDRWPWLPEDFRWEHYLAAPTDQRLETHWRGDEAIELDYLHPDFPHVRARLPAHRPRAFLKRHGNDGLDEVPLVLDTIVVDSDQGQVMTLWRGLQNIAALDLEELEHAFVTHHRLGADLSVEECTRRYHQQLDAEADEWDPDHRGPVPREEVSGEVVLPWDQRADEAPPAPEAANSAATEEDDEDDDDLPDDPAAAVEKLVAGFPLPPEQKRALLDVARSLGPASTPPKVDATQLPKDIDALTARLAELGLDVDPELAEEIKAEALEDDEDEPEEDWGATEAPPGNARAMVYAAHMAGESCAGWDLSDADLSDLELDGGDFRGAFFVGADLTGTIFDGADLTGAQLGEARIDAASFVGAKLFLADLCQCEGRVVVFDEADLTGATALGAKLPVASFRGANLERSEWMGADLSTGDFEGASLERADLSGCRLDGARFVSAKLVDTWLADGVRAPGACFDGADITLLRADGGSDFTGASFAKVEGEGARFGGANLDGVDLSFSALDESDFSGVSAARVKLMACRLRSARFNGADLRAADFTKSDLLAATFEGADLRGANLRGCNLYGAEFWKAELEGVQLELANLTRTKLEDE